MYPSLAAFARSFAAVAVLLCLVAGCSPPPEAVAPPSIPSSAGSEAISMYDKDGDSALNEEELKAAPGLLSALSLYDTNSDKKLTADEIYNRLYKITTGPMAITAFSFEIHDSRGQPLANANVKMTPEPFLGDSVKPAQGVTNEQGRVSPVIPADLLPAGEKDLRGIQPGVYKIEVTHPSVEIPAQYNTQTTLGQEISADNPAMFENTVFKIE